MAGAEIRCTRRTPDWGRITLGWEQASSPEEEEPHVAKRGFMLRGSCNGPYAFPKWPYSGQEDP